MKDYYKILGLDKNSNQDDIKKRFRELALEYHPDISALKNAHDIFLEINEAYQVLSDNSQKLYYDSLLNEKTENINENLKPDFENFKSSARQKAKDFAKKDYRSYIKDLDCFYSEQKKADGTPFNYFMHLATGIKGGIGPMGSIKSKSVHIPIPRSKSATITHRLGFLIKLIFLIVSFACYKFAYPLDLPEMIKLLYSSIILLSGGLMIFIIYRLKGVKSKQFHSKNFVIVKKYKSKGFQRGAHPMISTTPIGIIIFIIRWIL